MIAAVYTLFFFFLLISSVYSKATISISPQTLNRSGDIVVIKWSGVESPSDLDWLGIYSPPDSPHDHFIGYKFLSDSPTWQSGSGSISLPLTNLRSNYTFRIFHWTQSEINPKHQDHDHNPLPGTRHLLTESNQLNFRFAVNRPEQIHLSYTDNINEMRVVFVTGDGEEREARYGEVKDKLDNIAVARGVRYEIEHMCHAPANSTVGWRDPGWTFDAVMKNLKQGIRYYYQVGSDLKGWSEIHSFVSRNEGSEETLAFMFGDMGCYSKSAMDKTQLILLGLPIFLLCSDLFNLFTPPPPKSQHQSPPSISETLDFPAQKSTGVGYGNTVEINFCISCSYKGTAVSMKKMLESVFPGLDVVLANYPAPAPKRILAKVVPVAQVGVIGLIMGGEQIFPMIGIAQPPAWYHSLRANRFGSMASTWLLGNFLQSFLQSSGAFEVSCNGELVFSKLKEGRFPGEIELRDLISGTMTKPFVTGSY